MNCPICSKEVIVISPNLMSGCVTTCKYNIYSHYTFGDSFEEFFVGDYCFVNKKDSNIFEIHNYHNPDISRLHIFSLIVTLDGCKDYEWIKTKAQNAIKLAKVFK